MLMNCLNVSDASQASKHLLDVDIVGDQSEQGEETYLRRVTKILCTKSKHISRAKISIPCERDVKEASSFERRWIAQKEVESNSVPRTWWSQYNQGG